MFFNEHPVRYNFNINAEIIKYVALKIYITYITVVCNIKVKFIKKTNFNRPKLLIFN